MNNQVIASVIFILYAISGHNFYIVIENKRILNLSDFLYLACGIILHPFEASLITYLGIIRRSSILSRNNEELFFSLYKGIFGSISIFLFSFIYHYLSEPFNIFSFEKIGFNILSFYIALLVYLFFENTVDKIHKIISFNAPFFIVFRINPSVFSIYLFVAGPLSYFIGVLYLMQPLTIFLLLPTIFVLHTSINNYSKLITETYELLKKIASINDSREPYAENHSFNVARLAIRLAYEMNLGESTVNSIVNAGYLHDIGKITVSDSILFKKELTEEEYNLIKKHSEIGSSIISNLDFSKEEAHIIRHHHEWYDGSGYPDGIKGERIPVGSRILAVADAYDTLSSGRIYQKPLTKNEILKILFQNNNDQFDPEVLKTLAKII